LSTKISPTIEHLLRQLPITPGIFHLNADSAFTVNSQIFDRACGKEMILRQSTYSGDFQLEVKVKGSSSWKLTAPISKRMRAATRDHSF
jgi:hypothetical protein